MIPEMDEMLILNIMRNLLEIVPCLLFIFLAQSIFLILLENIHVFVCVCVLKFPLGINSDILID